MTTFNPVFVDNMDNKVNHSYADWSTRVYFIYALDQSARRNPCRREMIVATITVVLWDAGAIHDASRYYDAPVADR